MATTAGGIYTSHPGPRFPVVGSGPPRDGPLKNSPSIKLLFLSPWFPNRVLLQDGNFVQRCAEAVSTSHSVTVLHVGEDPELSAPLELETTDLEWGKVIRVYYRGGGARVQRLWRRRRAWQAGIAALAPASFDLLHAHVMLDGGIVAAHLSRRWKLPFVVSEHAQRFLEPWPTARLPERWLARWAASRAAALLPVSEVLRQGMVQHGLRGHYRVLPNLVNERLFRPPTAPHASDSFTFLHVSDLSPNKNVATIIRAFGAILSRYPHARLHLAANGDPAPYLALVRTLHLPPGRIRFSGPHAPERIASLMQAADCYVLASTVETQGVVLLEALLTGLPCVATRCGGPEEILAGFSGCALVPVGDPEALMRALEQQITATAPVASRRERAAAAARRYGQTATLAALEEVYRRAVSGG